VKNAPFTNRSPSDLQFHPFHSLSGASSCFVTYTISPHHINIYSLKTLSYYIRDNIIQYLFAESVIGCNKPIALTIDGWVCTSSNGVHFPVGVVIVHHMKISMPTPATNHQHFFFSFKFRHQDPHNCKSNYFHSFPSHFSQISPAKQFWKMETTFYFTLLLYHFTLASSEPDLPQSG